MEWGKIQEERGRTKRAKEEQLQVSCRICPSCSGANLLSNYCGQLRIQVGMNKSVRDAILKEITTPILFIEVRVSITDHLYRE